MWPETGTTVFVRKVSDGNSTTLLVVEVANSGIHWMEPRDLHVLQMAPTINAKSGQGISSRHTGGALVLFGDGSSRYVRDNLSAADLRIADGTRGGHVRGIRIAGPSNRWAIRTVAASAHFYIANGSNWHRAHKFFVVRR